MTDGTGSEAQPYVPTTGAEQAHERQAAMSRYNGIRDQQIREKVTKQLAGLEGETSNDAAPEPTQETGAVSETPPTSEVPATQVSQEPAAQPQLDQETLAAKQFFNAYRQDPNGFLTYLADKQGILAEPEPEVDPYEGVDFDMADPLAVRMKDQVERLEGELRSLRQEQANAVEAQKKQAQERYHWKQSFERVKAKYPDADEGELLKAKAATGNAVADPETLYKIAAFERQNNPTPDQVQAAQRASNLVQTSEQAGPSAPLSLDGIPKDKQLEAVVNHAMSVVSA